MHKRFSWWLAALLVAMPWVSRAADAPRVVALGGDITEIVYALDAQQALVGVDSTSQWPEAARQLPDVGYVRQLAAEGVLSLHPQLVLATHDAGPPAVLDQLRAAGVRIETLPVARTPDAVVAKVEQVGNLVGRKAAAETLANQLRGQYAALGRAVAAMPRHPRVLFLMSAGAGSPMAAGRDTAADSAIMLAGGVNAASGLDGYKAVSPESLAALAPDVIMMMRERSEAWGGIDGALKLPGVAMTPAGRARRVVLVEGQALLGFGARNAAQELAVQRVLAAIQLQP